MVEARITRIGAGAYEVCFVLGLLDTYTVQKHFSSVKEARDYIRAHTPSHKKLPIIVH
jgi:hypothetical protein